MPVFSLGLNNKLRSSSLFAITLLRALLTKLGLKLLILVASPDIAATPPLINNPAVAPIVVSRVVRLPEITPCSPNCKAVENAKGVSTEPIAP